MMWAADEFDSQPTEYDERLTFGDRRAIKRLLRSIPGLSQVVRSMTVLEDGAVEVVVGNPRIFSVLLITQVNQAWAIASREDHFLS